MTAKISGPVFDGQAEAAAESFCVGLDRTLAEEAVARIKAYLPTQYKYLGHSGGSPRDNPVPKDAGYYEAQIHAEAVGEAYLVTDTPAVYGPWLEGVSDLNNARRFPGYGAFRQTSQQLDAEAVAIAETELPPHLAAMNM
jgi:hypothetical protein